MRCSRPGHPGYGALTSTQGALGSVPSNRAVIQSTAAIVPRSRVPLTKRTSSHELTRNRRTAGWPPAPALLRPGDDGAAGAHVEVVALPGADLDLLDADSVISLTPSAPSGDGIAHFPAPGVRTSAAAIKLTAAAIGRLRAAEELARQSQPRVALLSGWAGEPPVGGGEQLRAAQNFTPRPRNSRASGLSRR